MKSEIRYALMKVVSGPHVHPEPIKDTLGRPLRYNTEAVAVTELEYLLEKNGDYGIGDLIRSSNKSDYYFIRKIWVRV